MVFRVMVYHHNIHIAPRIITFYKKVVSYSDLWTKRDFISGKFNITANISFAGYKLAAHT